MTYFRFGKKHAAAISGASTIRQNRQRPFVGYHVRQNSSRTFLGAKGDWGAWNQMRDSESAGSRLSIATGQGQEELEGLIRWRQRQEVAGGANFVSPAEGMGELLTRQL